MTRRDDRLTLAAEVVWLLVSTTLLAVVAAQEPGHWRFLCLTLLVINAAVVGHRISHAFGQLRAAQSRR